MSSPNVLSAVTRLGTAFRARDLAGAMDCFVDDSHICYEGSEYGEKALGRPAVEQLLRDLFARPEAYTWEIRDAEVFAADGIAYVSCDLTGYVFCNGGDRESFPYRLCGLLELTPVGWRWRACHGCEPAFAGHPFNP